LFQRLAALFPADPFFGPSLADGRLSRGGSKTGPEAGEAARAQAAWELFFPSPLIAPIVENWRFGPS
jgi:hypothetical protein